MTIPADLRAQSERSADRGLPGRSRAAPGLPASARRQHVGLRAHVCGRGRRHVVRPCTLRAPAVVLRIPLFHAAAPAHVGRRVPVDVAQQPEARGVVGVSGPARVVGEPVDPSARDGLPDEGWPVLVVEADRSRGTWRRACTGADPR